jgi:hypothetical protein
MPVIGMVHRKKKVRKFPVPSRDVTTKLSLGGKNYVITELFLPRESLVSDIPAGDGKREPFLRCTVIANDGRRDGLLLDLYSNSLTIVTYIVHMRHK